MNPLRRFLAGLLVSLLAFAPAAEGATAAQKAVVLSGIQSWSLPGSSADLYFAQNAGSCAINRLAKPCASLLSTTRASTGYAQWADGHYSSFGNNVPRITDQGLLAEQAATNLFLQSNTFSTSPWVLDSGVTLVPNAADGPLGTATMWKLVESSNNSPQRCSQTNTATLTAATYTYSLFAKAGERTWITVQPTGSGTPATNDVAWFNLGTGAKGTIQSNLTATITPSAMSGIYLITISFTASASTAGIRISPTTGDAVTSYQGNGTSGIYISQSQIELGSFPTSPILTTTGAATRAADVITLTGAAQTAALAAKAALAQTNMIAGGSGPRILNFNGGAALNANPSTQMQIQDGTNNAAATIGSAGTISGVVKTAFGFDATSMTVLANGGTPGTQTTSIWPTNATSPVYLGNRADALRALNGYLRRLTLGPKKGMFDGLTQ